MSETPETPSEPVSVTTGTPDPGSPYATDPNRRLYQVAAWIVIVAGVSFIVTLVLFFGLAFIRHAPFGLDDDFGGFHRESPGVSTPMGPGMHTGGGGHGRGPGAGHGGGGGGHGGGGCGCGGG